MSEKVVLKDIGQDIESAYLNYAMTTITDRALPDIRDGLKPVHRRIIYSMHKNKITHDKTHKKSATIVGDVMGHYHPHGDSAIYQTLVRLAQPFSMRAPLIDGQGNFGTLDNNAAHMRYTECRLSQLATELVSDLDKDVIKWVDNFDGSEKEPLILPAAFPNLLVNGSMGIAVGMATKIPPHNLREVINATQALIANPDITTTDLIQYLPGPDFPSGPNIDVSNVSQIYHTGKGKIIQRAIIDVDSEGLAHHLFTIHNLPYKVGPEQVISEIKELHFANQLSGLINIRDESSKNNPCIVLEVDKSVSPGKIVAILYRETSLQDSFDVTLLGLLDNQPQLFSLKKILQEFITHRKNILIRRSYFILQKLQKRYHVLDGYLKILLDIDKAIALIRQSHDVAAAKQQLMQVFFVDEDQAKAILELKLQRLTKLGTVEITTEMQTIQEEMDELSLILQDDSVQYTMIHNDLERIKKVYGDARRSEIVESFIEYDEQSLIDKENVIVIIDQNDSVKVVAEDSNVDKEKGHRFFHTTNHNHLMVYSSAGMLYRIPIHHIPIGNKVKLTSLLGIVDGKIISIHTDDNYTETNSVIVLTRNGMVRKSKCKEFNALKKIENKIIKLKDMDSVVAIAIGTEKEDVLCLTQNGYALRFANNINAIGLNTQGVKSIKLKPNDYVIGGGLINEEAVEVLLVTSKNIARRVSLTKITKQTRATLGCTIHKNSNEGLINLGLIITASNYYFMDTKKKVNNLTVEDIPVENNVLKNGVSIANIVEIYQ